MKYIYYAIGTVGGVGFSPIAPGTAGALVGVLLVYWLHPSTLILLAGILLFTVLGIWVSRKIEEMSGKEDPGLIVVDELVGQWINLLWIPFHWKYFLAGFLLFRLFDIAKPWPVHQSQQFGNGIGVMLDDILAGIYGLIVLHVMIYFGL
jgi:phosphatidylglycerophosphatase A